MVNFHERLQEMKRRREAGEPSFAEQMVAEQEQKDLQILSVIGSTEPSTFNELCNGLRRLNICPEKGDKTGWGTLFRKLGEYKAEGLVIVEMDGRNMKSFQLTKVGADKVREFVQVESQEREDFEQFLEEHYSDYETVANRNKAPWED